MRRDAEKERERLDAWAEGLVMGLLYRAALSPLGLGTPVLLRDLRAAGAERYASVLRRVGSWRNGETWAVAMFAHGGFTYCEVVYAEELCSMYGRTAASLRGEEWRP